MNVKVYKNRQRSNAIKEAKKMAEQGLDQESRLAMIQMLIPLGLRAVEEELQAEVVELAGGRYRHNQGSIKRWGQNPGSVFVGDQKLKISVPRVRNTETRKELPLKAYQRLQEPSHVDEVALSRVINGISQGKYSRAAEIVPETFGISKSAVSQKFIRASAKRLQEFLTRDLSKHDIVAIFIDGKFFAENELVIALGVTLSGEKLLLGFVETSTKNTRSARIF